MRRALIGALCLLCGCQGSLLYQSAFAPGSITQTAGVNVQVSGHGNAVLGAIVVAVLLADGAQQYFLRYPDGRMVPYRPAAGPDPARRINLQDCTRPIDFEAGNLMCK